MSLANFRIDVKVIGMKELLMALAAAATCRYLIVEPLFKETGVMDWIGRSKPKNNSERVLATILFLAIGFIPMWLILRQFPDGNISQSHQSESFQKTAPQVKLQPLP